MERLDRSGLRMQALQLTSARCMLQPTELANLAKINTSVGRRVPRVGGPCVDMDTPGPGARARAGHVDRLDQSGAVLADLYKSATPAHLDHSVCVAPDADFGADALADR